MLLYAITWCWWRNINQIKKYMSTGVNAGNAPWLGAARTSRNRWSHPAWMPCLSVIPQTKRIFHSIKDWLPHFLYMHLIFIHINNNNNNIVHILLLNYPLILYILDMKNCTNLVPTVTSYHCSFWDQTFVLSSLVYQVPTNHIIKGEGKI